MRLFSEVFSVDALYDNCLKVDDLISYEYIITIMVFSFQSKFEKHLNN